MRIKETRYSAFIGYIYCYFIVISLFMDREDTLLGGARLFPHTHTSKRRVYMVIKEWFLVI